MVRKQILFDEFSVEKDKGSRTYSNIMSALSIEAYVRTASTLTGFKLLIALRICSNAKTRRPKRYRRKRYSFSTMPNIKFVLLPPSGFLLYNDILVTIHPTNDESLL